MKIYFEIAIYAFFILGGLYILACLAIPLVDLIVNRKRRKAARAWKKAHPEYVEMTLSSTHDGLYYKVFYHSVNGSYPVTRGNSLFLAEGENQIYLSIIAADWRKGLYPYPQLERPIRGKRDNGVSIINLYASIFRDYRSTLPENMKNGICLNLNVRKDANYSLNIDRTERTVTVYFDYDTVERYTYDTEHVHGEVSAKGDKAIPVAYRQYSRLQ